MRVVGEYRHDGEGGVVFLGGVASFKRPLPWARRRVPELEAQRGQVAGFDWWAQHRRVQFDEWIGSLQRSIEDAEWWLAEVRA